MQIAERQVVSLDEPIVGPRQAPQTAGWSWEWKCPRCERVYKHGPGLCAEDASPLRKIRVSLPFVWLG